MKRILVLTLVVFVAGFAAANVAQASYVNIYNLSYVYAPNSDTTSSTGTTTDDTSLNMYGSLKLGMPASTTDSNLGLYDDTVLDDFDVIGVGALLPDASGYNLWFDYHLRTFDSASFDLFKVVITQDDYYWNGGTEIGGWSWGGADYPGLETLDDGPAFRGFVGVTGGHDYYINAVLDTTNNSAYVSWGRISDIAVESLPVPEPTSMLLLGFGLVGLVAARRKLE